METNTLISIIIPCTRPRIVKNTIESILRQKNEINVDLEFIVVGNDVTDLESQFSIKTISNIGVKLTPGKARNLGAKISNGKFLLFIDDDCEAGEGWLKNNLLTLAAEEVGAASGKIVSKSKKYFARCVDFSNFDLCQSSRKSEQGLAAATLGIRKEVFLKASGFDENLLIGEDIDLCYKIMKIGYKTLYDPSIIVYHNHGREDFYSIIKYLYKGGRKGGLINQNRYPDLQGKAKFLLKVSHPVIFFYLIVPFAIYSTCITYRLNFKDNRDIRSYLPFIFLVKVAYFFGIFVWLVKDRKNAIISNSAVI